MLEKGDRAMRAPDGSHSGHSIRHFSLSIAEALHHLCLDFSRLFGCHGNDSLEEALEALPTVGDIIVSRTGPYIDHDGQGGFEWIISFTTNGFPSHLGEVPLLESNSQLVGTDADVDIEEVQEGNGPVVFV